MKKILAILLLGLTLSACSSDSNSDKYIDDGKGGNGNSKQPAELKCAP